MPPGLNVWGIGHHYDLLSGGYMKGTDGFFASGERSGVMPVIAQHSTSGFVNDLNAFLNAFVNSGGNNQSLINSFIALMKNKYNVTVTYVQ